MVFIPNPPAAAATGGQSLYGAIVAPSGGDYTLLSAAITGGETSILIRNGTYNESTDIRVPSDTVIIGESRDGVIIAFGSSEKSILVADVASDVYSGVAASFGSAAFAVDDATVTHAGAGTWTANVSAGDIIWNRAAPWGTEVASLTDGDTLELVNQHEGPSTGALNYCIAQSPTKNVQISNLTLTRSAGSTVYLIECIGAYRCIFDNIAFYIGRAMRLTRGNASNIIRNCISYDSTIHGFFHGLSGEDGHRNANNAFINCEVQNCGGTGFLCIGGSLGTKYDGCSVHGAVAGLHLSEQTSADPNRPYGTLIQMIVGNNITGDALEIGSGANGANFTFADGVVGWDVGVNVDDNGLNTQITSDFGIT